VDRRRSAGWWRGNWSRDYDGGMSVNATVLVGAGEIGRMLGCLSRRRVYRIVARRTFPAPAAELAQGTVWLTAEVEDWIRAHRRG